MIIEKQNGINLKEYIKEKVVYVKDVQGSSLVLYGEIKLIIFQRCDIKHIKIYAKKIIINNSNVGNLNCSYLSLSIKNSSVINLRDEFLIGRLNKHQRMNLIDSNIDFINISGINKKKITLYNSNIQRFVIHSCVQNGVIGLNDDYNSNIDSLIIYSTISIYFLMYNVNIFNLKVIGNVITGPYNKLIQNLYDI